MNLNQILKSIKKVTATNRVNIQLELNDEFSLLVEGGFSVSRDAEDLVNSINYIDSNCSTELLVKLQTSLENTNISSASFSEGTGKLIIELENGVIFESFFSEGDYESWELIKNGRTIYGSEGGSVVHY